MTTPVGWLMRPVVPLEATDSVERAASRLSSAGADGLPVQDEERYVGRVDQRHLSDWIGRSEGADLALGSLLSGEDAQTGRVSPRTTGAEALRLFESSGLSWLAVVDELDRVMGVIAPSDLLSTHEHTPRPRTVGGMATPFGVYLTTGNLRAGVSDWALMSTGALMFFLLLAASLATDGVARLLIHWHASDDAVFWTVEVLPFVLFMALLRAIPLAGIHAAEHQVVHAIERGEALTPSIVRRMPRVHPRCGTNFAVGLTMFLGLASAPWIGDLRLQLLFAVVATLLLWRRLGGVMQYWVTTRRPNEKHLAMGIRSGEALLDRLRTHSDAPASPLVRVYNSGLLQVMSGALLVYGIAFLVAKAFGYAI